MTSAPCPAAAAALLLPAGGVRRLQLEQLERLGELHAGTDTAGQYLTGPARAPR
jgi:hypothetical protein